MKFMARAGLMLSLTLPAHAEEGTPASFGRIFHSPAQRLARESIRHPPVSRPPAGPPESLRLDGIVRRGNAPALVWINGRLIADHSRISGVEANSLRITGADGVPRAIAVGETLLLETEGEQP